MSGRNSGFEIIFSPRAISEKSLRRFPPEGDLVKLEGQKDVFRLRVGNWRITFWYQFQKSEVHISEVVHRSKAYR